MNENLKKYIVEFTGTFFLVLTVACCVLLGTEGLIAPLAIGSVLMVMIYAGGHISGGHYNPAVSLAACMRGALDWNQLLPYSASQLAGGIFAVLVFKFMASGSILFVMPSIFDFKGMIIAEFLFTFALCYVVLQTATTKSTENNSYYGLAIGFTVLSGAFAVGGLCSAAFNPAVAFNLFCLDILPFQHAIFTIIANLLGGACAALLFNSVYKDKV